MSGESSDRRREVSGDRDVLRRASARLPAAVLFDMDGTLVDTEPHWVAAEYALVEKYGEQWTPADSKALVGGDLLTSAEYIRSHAGVDLPPETIVEFLLAEVTARTRLDVPWRPGARELLAAVRAAGVATGLVTMSWRSLTDTVVEVLPAGSFDVVVTGDAVTRGKPHPEPYATAMDRLGADPDLTVAIEDSPNGVASAHAAGCRVLAVPHSFGFEPPAGVVIRDTLVGLRPADLLGMFDRPAG